jgi:hypothetical protein
MVEKKQGNMSVMIYYVLETEYGSSRIWSGNSNRSTKMFGQLRGGDNDSDPDESNKCIVCKQKRGCTLKAEQRIAVRYSLFT